MIEQFVAHVQEAHSHINACVICGSGKDLSKLVIFPKEKLAELTDGRPVAYGVCDDCKKDEQRFVAKATGTIVRKMCESSGLIGACQ